MTRVLRIINRFNLGGITYNVTYLSRFLGENFETFLAGGPEEKGEESSLYIPQSLGLEPLVLPEMRRSVNPFTDALAIARIRKLIRSFSPHILHTHASKAGAAGRIAALTIPRRKRPIIVHTFHGHVFHGYFGPAVTGLYKVIERFLASRSDAIVAISERQKHELAVIHRICEPSKVRVIPLGFDLSRFTQGMEEKRRLFRIKHGLKDTEIVLGIIGRIVPIKNHRLFLDAVRHVVSNTGVAVKAVVVGDGETRAALEAYATELRLDDVVIFTGWMKDADVAIAGVDVVCLTSTNEGTPVSLIEAQAAGKFIVTTNVGGISDILHPFSAFLSEAGDARAYSRNLLRAVEEFKTLSADAGEAKEHVIRKFSYQRLCADMAELYEDLLNAQSRRIVP
jgi:glycosyltransferase involved in cell wall biosynthesis